MNIASTAFSRRIAEATATVFGDTPLTTAVEQACARYEKDLSNIQTGRGIPALLIAIVGAKGQGKTWAARQFVLDEALKSRLRSGDLSDDATTRLVWIGPVAPEELDPSSEIYYPCQSSQLVQLGQPYVLLDTPGLTDANHRAAKLATEALSLAPLKLLIIARDQIRAAANLAIARQIDGAFCVPVISSVEPDEMPGAAQAPRLAEDLRGLREQLAMMAPHSQLTSEVLVPDFEITGDEAAASQAFLSGLLDLLSQVGLTELTIGNAREVRLKSAGQRLQREVARLVGDALPQLSDAVQQLHRETEQLPRRVLASLLGSETVLETGVRMRLRARLAADTSLIWFPYRTMLSTLNLTQGAWDRVMLAMTGSVPSLFGALASWARNYRQTRDFESDVQDGVRRRTQAQVEERLRPLCDQFHRAVLKLRPREQRIAGELASAGVRLTGIDELQTRSQEIFDRTIDRHTTSFWVTQLLALLGTIIFWALLAGPIVVTYREYLSASAHVFTGQEAHLESFPHPTPGLFFTSLLLSILPMAIYCMLVLTVMLSRRKLRRIAGSIVAEHEAVIEQLQQAQVIRLQFEDELLQQAECLLQLQRD